MKYKKFMPCIWLYQKRAVQRRDNLKELEFDPTESDAFYENLEAVLETETEFRGEGPEAEEEVSEEIAD